MRRIMIALIVPLMLGGCIAYHDNPPATNTTVVVPPGSMVACPSGMAPPC